jgi:hypothetical protein
MKRYFRPTSTLVVGVVLGAVVWPMVRTRLGGLGGA